MRRALKWTMIAEIRRRATAAELAAALGRDPGTIRGLLSTGRVSIRTLERWADALGLEWSVELVDRG